MIYTIRKFATLFLDRVIRRSKMLTRILFGIKIVYSDKAHWDFTTLVFKYALVDTTKPKDDILEIGTGPHAILSIYLAKRIKCNITASDINSEYVENAINTANRNDVDIKIIKSDLFENIKSQFDMIFWNSIYIPRAVGEKIDIDKICKYKTDWCGGETGLEGIEKLLNNSKSHLKNNGLLLIGFSRVYLNEDAVIEKCRNSGYSVEKIIKRPLNPSRVFIVKNKIHQE